MSLEVHILEKRFGRRREKSTKKTVDEIFYISIGVYAHSALAQNCTGVHTQCTGSELYRCSHIVHWLRTVQVFTHSALVQYCKVFTHSALVQYCMGVNIQYTGSILYRCLHIMHWFNTVEHVSITDKQMSTSVYHFPTLSEGSVYQIHWPSLSVGICVPLANFVGGICVPLPNFVGGICVPLAKFVRGTCVPLVNFISEDLCTTGQLCQRDLCTTGQLCQRDLCTTGQL